MESQKQLIPEQKIICKEISKNFDTSEVHLKVLQNINMSIHDNEFVVILGPGQCGKTTLINLIAGLDTPTTGEVWVNNKKVSGPDPDRGVVYQRTALFPWFSVINNVNFGLRMRRIPKKERDERSQYYIDLVGLKGFEKSFPAQLSGGMCQRVGIARAYCNDPVVMLMDEPFGHLDAQTRYLMQEELQRIWNMEKRTVLFVTNNIEEALYLADRVIILTNCPTVIRKEFVVNLPRPRDYVSKEFLNLRKEISGFMETTL